MPYPSLKKMHASAIVNSDHLDEVIAILEAINDYLHRVTDEGYAGVGYDIGSEVSMRLKTLKRHRRVSRETQINNKQELPWETGTSWQDDDETSH